MNFSTTWACMVLIALIACDSNENKKAIADMPRDTATLRKEMTVIKQTLPYLDPKAPVPNWDSPFGGVMSQGLEGEPVWVGFMSGVFMPLDPDFDQRVKRLEADWGQRFRDIDTAYRPVFRKLLVFWNPAFPPKTDSLPLDKLPPAGPNDVMWQHWAGYPASDTYNLYAFETPVWLNLHAVADEPVLRFPYRKLGTLGISHVAFSDDGQRACYLYDIWGYSGHRYGVIFARRLKEEWVREADLFLSIS